MDPLTVVGAVIGNEISKKLESWSASRSSYSDIRVERRKDKIESGQDVTLTGPEVEIVERYMAVSHGEKRNYEDISLETYEKPEYNVDKFVEDKQLGPYEIYGNKIICFGKPTDKETGFRSYKYKCAYCDELSVHINKTKNIKIESKYFQELAPSDRPFIDNEFKVSENIEDIMNNITNIELIGKDVGRRDYGGYICSKCGDLNWVKVESHCNCGNGIGIGSGYRDVVPLAAAENSATISYCMLCGADHSLIGGIF